MRFWLKLGSKRTVFVIISCLLFLTIYLITLTMNTTEEEAPLDKYMQAIFQAQLSSRRIVIVLVGAGPTALGVLHRLYDLGYDSLPNLQIIVLEQGKDVGGSASSYRDVNGFLWDNGGFIKTSRHLQYINSVMDSVVAEWNTIYDDSYVFMMGKDHKRRFIPYPVEMNLEYMDSQSQNECLRGLKRARGAANSPTHNYDEWLVEEYGEELSNIFLRKYNSKEWAIDLTLMGKTWIETKPRFIPTGPIRKVHQNANGVPSHLRNGYFRFPKYNGTSGTWKGVASKLPEAWFHHGYKMVGVDVDNKTVQVQLTSADHDNVVKLKYDVLINTGPLDLLINMASDYNQQAKVLKQSADSALIYSHAHVIGLGLRGRPPSILQHKSWIYFPDKDSPFHRAVLLSSFSDDTVPYKQIDKYWSLLCEALEPIADTSHDYDWSKDGLIEATIKALETYGYITRDQIISKYYNRMEYGRPIPTIKRDAVLKDVRLWLESKSVYSRGLFGGWKYEVGNQDQAFMQGVELVNWLILDKPETIYTNSTQYVSNDRPSEPLPLTVSNGSKTLEYELVISHYEENLTHWLPYASLSTVYHKGSNKMPDFRFRKWKNLPNVGREGHSMLHHIISNYNSSLAKVTIFFQASVSDSEKIDCYTRFPSNYFKKALRNGFAAKSKPTRFINGFHHAPKTINYKSFMVRSKFTFQQYWKYIFGTDMPRMIKWTPCSCFGVSRERIRSRPKSFYERIFKTLSHNSNPQEGHYMERMWYSIFSKAI